MPSSPNAIISLPGLRKEAGSRASAGMCQGSSGPAIKRHSASKSVVERRRTSPQRQQNASPEEVGSGGIGSMSGALEPWALGACACSRAAPSAGPKRVPKWAQTTNPRQHSQLWAVNTAARACPERAGAATRVAKVSREREQAAVNVNREHRDQHGSRWSRCCSLRARLRLAAPRQQPLKPGGHHHHHHPLHLGQSSDEAVVNNMHNVAPQQHVDKVALLHSLPQSAQPAQLVAQRAGWLRSSSSIQLPLAATRSRAATLYSRAARRHHHLQLAQRPP